MSDALGRTGRYAYLARNCFSNRKAFSVQSSRLFDNGAGPIPEGFEDVNIRYPHQTISEASLTAIAGRMGFDLIAGSTAAIAASPAAKRMRTEPTFYLRGDSPA